MKNLDKQAHWDHLCDFCGSHKIHLIEVVCKYTRDEETYDPKTKEYNWEEKTYRDSGLMCLECIRKTEFDE